MEIQGNKRRTVKNRFQGTAEDGSKTMQRPGSRKVPPAQSEEKELAGGAIAGLKTRDGKDSDTKGSTPQTFQELPICRKIRGLASMMDNDDMMDDCLCSEEVTGDNEMDELITSMRVSSLYRTGKDKSIT